MPDQASYGQAVRSGQELVELVMARLEVGDAELARWLGLPSYASPQRVKRWRTGLNEPAYAATVALLDAAGFLTEEGRLFLGLRDRPGSREDTGGLEAEAARAQAQAEDVERRLGRPGRSGSRKAAG